MSLVNDRSRMLISAAGIFVSYSVFGVLQEKITRGRYGDELNEDGTIGEQYTFTLALVGVQCLFNWLFAKGKILLISFLMNENHVILLTMLYL